MKDLSFYEQVGILLPGSVLLLGILFLTPELRQPFLDGGISVGGLGLFLIVAYALGHIVAAGGNLLEKLVWIRGRPSEWPVRAKDTLLDADDIKLVQDKLKARVGITVKIKTLTGKQWQGHFRRLYAEVQTAAPDDLAQTYNGNYGLNRGFAVAMLLVAIGCVVRQPPNWPGWTLGFAAGAGIYLYRMRLFGRLFAERVYRRFIQLPDAREPVKAADG